jgi:hypothetical protein
VNFYSSNVMCFWARAFRGTLAGKWSLTLNVETLHGHVGGGVTGGSMLHTAAVVDDFGTLVVVQPWY